LESEKSIKKDLMTDLCVRQGTEGSGEKAALVGSPISDVLGGSDEAVKWDYRYDPMGKKFRTRKKCQRLHSRLKVGGEGVKGRKWENQEGRDPWGPGLQPYAGWIGDRKLPGRGNWVEGNQRRRRYSAMLILHAGRMVRPGKRVDKIRARRAEDRTGMGKPRVLSINRV